MLKDKKAQTKGLVIGIVFGIVSLIIGAIIAFLIISTLTNSDLLADGRVTTSVTNERGWINNTGYTLNSYSTSDKSLVLSSFSISSMYNGTKFVPAANYTFSSGILKNATVASLNNVSINYSYESYTVEELSAQGLDVNFTQGINNVSTKIPTVLLVAAIVLILGILVLLVAAWQRMRIGGGGGI